MTGTAAVALLRNLNHGQRNSPSGRQLVAAFAAVGATAVRTVGGNGTVVFVAGDPIRCTDDAVRRLGAESPWGDVGFGFAADELAALLPDPVAPAVEGRLEFSAFGPGPRPAAPVTGRRCEVMVLGDRHALSVNERDGESRATPTLEGVLGRPVTSRALGTVRRALSAAVSAS